MHETHVRSARLLFSLALASFLTFAAFGDVPLSDLRIGRGAGMQSNPASATNGRDFLLTWEDTRSGQWEIYATRVQADGTVLDAEGILVSAGETGAYRPSVVWAGNSYIVTWLEAGLQYRRIWPDGRVGAIQTVYNDYAMSPAVAAAGDTAIIAAYRPGHGILFTAVGPDDVALSIGEIPRAGSARVACTDSDCLVSLDYGNSLQGRFIGLHGERLDSPEFALATDAYRDALAATGDRFFAVWTDSAKRVWGREVGSSHTFEPFLIAQAKHAIERTDVTASGRDFIVSWTERRYGPRWQVETHLRSLSDDNTITKAGEVSAISSNGTQHIAAWRETGYKIAAGMIRDGVFESRIAVTRTATAQAEPQVVHCGDHLLTVWSEELQGTGKWSVMARRFTESGEPLDAQPIVVADSLYSQGAPDVAFDGHSYLFAWSEDGHGVFARAMGRDGALAPHVLTLADDDVRGESPAVTATDRGFAVLYRPAEIRAELRLTSIEHGSPSAPLVVSTVSSGQYAVSWNGSEVVALWGDYEGVIRGARIAADGVLLDRDPIVVGFGRNNISSPSLSCDASRCVAAWHEWHTGVKSASIVGGNAFPISEAFVEAADYRDAPTERYSPSVVRRNGAYEVFSSDAHGRLYARSIANGVASPEAATNLVRTNGSSSIIAISKGLLIVEQRQAFGPGFGGALRLYLRYLSE